MDGRTYQKPHELDNEPQELLLEFEPLDRYGEAYEYNTRVIIKKLVLNMQLLNGLIENKLKNNTNINE